MIDRRLITNFDWPLFFLTIILSVIGVINLYSTSQGVLSGNIYVKQIYWFIIGLLALFLIFCIDYRFFEKWGYLIYFLFFLLLLTVFFHGSIAYGAKRWLKFGGIRFQPSELMKLAMIIALGKYFHGQRNDLKGEKKDGYRLRDLWVPFILALIPVMLILKQPDLGTAIIFLFIFISIIFYMRIRLSSFFILCGIILFFVPIFWHFLKDYQRSRILTFFNPSRDPLGLGYQIIQSKIAVGSGGLWGKGFLHGTQSKLHFLPTQHTDFVFSVFSEEWGLIGSILVLILFCLLIIWGLSIANQSKDLFGKVVAFGITSMLFWQVVINIGMATSLLPVVGVPLPFFSYGGSSTVTTLIAIGLLINVKTRRFIF
ncbi:MAG: rod shape-determining protein RodA [Spirochaetes bacterium]|nr:rod shape-determining protein RodA [Deltaproteobacteria bacterium]RKY01428.1 MAG: rod shape-determining protein RodA [Spirochaetota bacterium]